MSGFNNTTQLNSTAATASHDLLFIFVSSSDHVFRYLSLIVHLIFIIVLIITSETRTRNLLYVNHATVISTFYPLIQFFFIFGNTPNFPDPQLNQILCTAAGYFRDLASVIRPYSILIIAIYRYIAVFHLNLFARLNRSNGLLITPIILVWLVSIGIPIVVSKSIGVTVSSFLCINGSSRSIFVAKVYFFIYCIVLLVPNLTTMALYVRIMIELRHIKRRVRITGSRRALGIARMTTTIVPSLSSSVVTPVTKTTSSMTHSSKTRPVRIRLDSSKEESFAKHFFLMCTAAVLTTSVYLVFYMNQIINNYFAIMYYWQPVLRVIISIGVSLVPITSLYFHPARVHFLNWITIKFGLYG